MANKDSRHRAANDTLALLASNWVHYIDTFKILNDFAPAYSSNNFSHQSEKKSPNRIPVEKIVTAPENMLVPTEDYLSLYCDLLGFSAEMNAEGMDSLPDFYGAAFGGAHTYPQVNTYLLSDSLLAFAKLDDASIFRMFITEVVLNWRADGLLPQCIVGYGSFVERKPDFGWQPPNFLGVQVAGTALIDAANILKKGSRTKPLGARVIVTRTAAQALSQNQSFHIVRDNKRNLELFLEASDKIHLFDCVYYLLCLRTVKPGSRVFNHYVWSIASRAFNGGTRLLELAVQLVDPLYPKGDIATVTDKVESVLQGYQPVRT